LVLEHEGAIQGGIMMRYSILLMCCGFVCGPLAAGAETPVPFAGAWGAVIPEFPGEDVKACAPVLEYGLAHLSGHTLGQVVAFTRKKRLDFGGYMDDESIHVSVTPKSDGSVMYRDRWYDDGEGGGREGYKIKTYVVRQVDPTHIEITENKMKQLYLKCERPHAPEQAAKNLPRKVGECVETTIAAITDRFGKNIMDPSQDSNGTRVGFANGGGQVSYDRETAIVRSRVGDKVRMCLQSVPSDCPAGDDRGKIYNTRNLRTGEAWSLSDSQHRCGGA
jgi:hypothetical protein